MKVTFRLGTQFERIRRPTTALFPVPPIQSSLFKSCSKRSKKNAVSSISKCFLYALAKSALFQNLSLDPFRYLGQPPFLGCLARPKKKTSCFFERLSVRLLTPKLNAKVRQEKTQKRIQRWPVPPFKGGRKASKIGFKNSKAKASGSRARATRTKLLRLNPGFTPSIYSHDDCTCCVWTARGELKRVVIWLQRPGIV